MTDRIIRKAINKISVVSMHLSKDLPREETQVKADENLVQNLLNGSVTYSKIKHKKLISQRAKEKV